MPPMSFVASPEPEEQFTAKQLDENSVAVRGYAVDGSGHLMARVDASLDGGSPAEVDDHGMKQEHKRNHHWSWYS